MTLDDLMKVYSDGFSDCLVGTEDGLQSRRAGIRAVVEALRDEMTRLRYSLGSLAAFDTLDEILASDGEKGTHGSPELDEDARKLEAMGQYAGPTVQDLFPEVFEPAADPVCEWTPVWKDKEYRSCSADGTYSRGAREEGDRCPNCDKPISFKSEAAR